MAMKDDGNFQSQKPTKGGELQCVLRSPPLPQFPFRFGGWFCWLNVN
jgi:hypothetical protein